VLLVATLSRAQQRDPHIGYLYPAGARQGATVDITLGGQYLRDATNVYVTGHGVYARVRQYVKPIGNNERGEMNKKMREVQKRRQKEAKKNKGKSGGVELTDWPADLRDVDIEKLSLKGLGQLRTRLYDPKAQPNAQLAEKVVIRVKVSPKAKPEEREIRLLTKTGASNPMAFHVGRLPEHLESEPNDMKAGKNAVKALPAVLNGQIMPGDVDRFRFKTGKGKRMVVATQARKLVPYLADAVPGWFQATVALYDTEGRELAFVDDFRFDPDPVLLYTIPENGEYVLEIRDSIYRGREDFVYRIAIGELPFVTSVFPLGLRAGTRTTLALRGWNLPMSRLTLDGRNLRPGRHEAAVTRNGRMSNPIAYGVDTLEEVRDTEPNDSLRQSQSVRPRVTINGRIGKPGDWDVFRFSGRAGQEIVAEVYGRRLNSPIDSVLRLTDAKGGEIAVNDDHVDKGSGLVTHHADSFLRARLPAAGHYYVHLGDTQQKGGEEYAYRLRISPPRIGFELRVVPSSLSMRPGATATLDVHAVRHDGFNGNIELKLKDAPDGFFLDGGWVPRGLDKVRVTLSAPAKLPDRPMSLKLEGHTTYAGRTIEKPAVAAEDMMQAFLWRHLVPATDLIVTKIPQKWKRPPTRLASKGKTLIRAGGTAKVKFKTPNRNPPKDIQFELSEPPKGISIERTTPVDFGMEFVLGADRDNVEDGLKGNLIINAFMERAPKDKNGKPRGPKRRVSVGPLPAIPFEVVKR